jgi:hypothetical protein
LPEVYKQLPAFFGTKLTNASQALCVSHQHSHLFSLSHNQVNHMTLYIHMPSKFQLESVNSVPALPAAHQQHLQYAGTTNESMTCANGPFSRSRSLMYIKHNIAFEPSILFCCPTPFEPLHPLPTRPTELHFPLSNVHFASEPLDHRLFHS